MPTITRKRIRIAADVARLNAPLDELTGLTPAFYRGNDLQVEFGLFNNGVLQDVNNISSVTLEIKPSDDDLTPPDASVAPVMTQTIAAASLDAGINLTLWQQGAHQHGIIAFDATSTNITAGYKWLSLWVVTSDSPGRVITIAAGPLRVLEDGASGSIQEPPAPTSSYYTSTQSDARYAQRGQNLADIASPSAARTNLGLGTAATANTGTASGNIPVLDGSGKLATSVLPSIDTTVGATRGGVVFAAGAAVMPPITVGRSDLDISLLVRREALGSQQYILSGTSGGLTLRFATNDKIRVGIHGVGDVLESTVAVVSNSPVWIRMKRAGGFTRLYLNDVEVGNVAETLNYTGTTSRLGALDDTGATDPLKATILMAVCWNRGVDDDTAIAYRTTGGVRAEDRWGSMTNIFAASSLVVGKRVYLKTSGSESITINGQVYRDGTSGSIDARNGLEIPIASSTITNGLTSASTLRYVGVLWDIDMAVGVGYQLHDRSGNNAHMILSESGVEHLVKRREWNFSTILNAAGYLGGAARAILPANHIIERLYTIGGSGITLSAGEAPAGTTLVTSLAATSGVAQATLGSLRSSNNRVYINYASGSGNVTVYMKGMVE